MEVGDLLVEGAVWICCILNVLLLCCSQHHVL